ncbi:hypothetical protein FMN50_20405 [Rhodobacterales bacterium]|nr:hypothetical protein FMN50_20405 [Rhodobacterales bacterium]
MKILRRNNGDWLMEHNGAEAPYDVVCHVEGKFSVFDMDDDMGDDPVASLENRETAERLTQKHFERTAEGGLGR